MRDPDHSYQAPVDTAKGSASSPKLFDESDWLGAPLSVDQAKLDAAPRPDRGTVQLKPKATRDFDKTSPYFHPCDKCRGSGSFYGYSGRYVGPCKTCKGKGGFMRAVTVEQKRAADQRKVVHEAEALVARLTAFQTSYPAQWAWMQAESPRFEFAQSMLDAVTKYGYLTEKQSAAVDRCIDKAAARKAEAIERAASAPVVQTDKLMAAFSTALASGLKNPILRFEGFVASLAKATSKNAGAVYIKAATGFDSVYYGKIQDGKFQYTRTCPLPIVEAVAAAMADPLASSIAYGKRVGQCSCCGRELTDPKSIAAGIGPICAAKYGFAL